MCPSRKNADEYRRAKFNNRFLISVLIIDLQAILSWNVISLKA